MEAADTELLRGLIEWSDEHDPDGERFASEPFRQMLVRARPLTDKQRTWARGVFERFCGGAPTYENLVSSGRVPRGREVPLPEVLRPENLPKRPPQRKA